jgi:3-hydroxypropanoate dehydrogenase
MTRIPAATEFDLVRPLSQRLDEATLDQLFREARTHNAWLDQPVPRALLEEAVDLAKMAPTALNAQPARFVFVESADAKARLKPALSPGNVDKTMAAPVTAILAHDTAFHDHLPRLFPHADVRPMFANNAEAAKSTARENATLQAAYFILALRSLGLDAGPMGGFDRAEVDAAFFAGTTQHADLLINIGYGDHSKLFPRNPRLAFHEMASFA